MALLLAALLNAAATSAAAPGDLIAYTRHGDISVMTAEGDDKTRLTRGAAWDSSPLWSPDGTRMAFIRCCSSVWRRGASALMVMNADGTGLREVSRDLRGQVHDASWSPDGEFLLYSDVIRTPEWEYRASLRVTDADGNYTRLTGYRHSNVGARWSPDGSKVLFLSDRSGDTDLYLMAPDGSWHDRLTNAAGADFWASWSPDGSQVAFMRESEEHGWSQHLYVVDVATGAEHRLTEGNVLDSAPAWRPDGLAVAFERWAFEPDFDAAIWLIDVRSRDKVRLAEAEGSPAWSPRGDQLLFGRRGDIWVIDADGAADRPLTTDLLYEGSPAWRPPAAAPPVAEGGER